jgi:hypothetical protein
MATKMARTPKTLTPAEIEAAFLRDHPLIQCELPSNVWRTDKFHEFLGLNFATDVPVIISNPDTFNNCFQLVLHEVYLPNLAKGIAPPNYYDIVVVLNNKTHYTRIHNWRTGEVKDFDYLSNLEMYAWMVDTLAWDNAQHPWGLFHAVPKLNIHRKWERIWALWEFAKYQYHYQDSNPPMTEDKRAEMEAVRKLAKERAYFAWQIQRGWKVDHSRGIPKERRF